MKTSNWETTVDILVRYCSVCDPISEIDVGHGIGGHRVINGVYRKVKEGLQSVLRIGSAHNKGGPPNINIV